jgi:hypothetical protein
MATLIDGPGPYVSLPEQRDWLEYLRSLPLDADVQRAIDDAEYALAHHPEADESSRAD